MFISDVITKDHFKLGTLNVVVSGCGTGKTYFCTHDLPSLLGIEPEQIIVVTSRALIRDQQAQDDSVIAHHSGDSAIYNFWNNEATIKEYAGRPGIRIMTNSKFIDLLTRHCVDGGCLLDGVKCIVFDECHSLIMDFFIDNIAAIGYFIGWHEHAKDKMLIGMTATPDVFYECPNYVPFSFKVVNAPLYRYKAQRLTICHYTKIARWISQQEGRTLVMCQTEDECRDIEKMLMPYTLGTDVLLSRSNTHYKADKMEYIYRSLERDSTIPELRRPYEGQTRRQRLRVLISTSVIREGVNLVEGSGVQNIVCLYHDPTDIIQVVGRCRYNVTNLCIVVGSSIRYKANMMTGYYNAYTNDCSDFINGTGTMWFERISNVVAHSARETIIRVNPDAVIRRSYVPIKDLPAFLKYIDNHWVGKKIFEEDKPIIEQAATRHGVRRKKDGMPSDFVGIVGQLKFSKLYDAQRGRLVIDHKRKYYTVISKLVQSPVDSPPNDSAIVSCYSESEEDQGEE